jgi:glutathione S-transferase
MPYAEERYLKEAHRLYSVLDRRLAQHEFVADDYSIADIAIWHGSRATNGRLSISTPMRT